MVTVYIYRLMKAECAELLTIIFDNEWCLQNSMNEQADDSTNSDDCGQLQTVTEHDYLVRDLCGLIEQ